MNGHHGTVGSSNMDCKSSQMHRKSPEELKSASNHCQHGFDDDDDDDQGFVITVPSEMVALSLGFAIDAGGSITKLLYRSKKDYENCRRKTQSGSSVGDVLRLKMLPRCDGRRVLDFINKYCDIPSVSLSGCGEKGLSNMSGESLDQPKLRWFHTGVGLQHYIQELDKTMNISTILMSETDAQVTALLNLYPVEGLLSAPSPHAYHTPPLTLQPVTCGALDRALEHVRSLITVISRAKGVEEALTEGAAQVNEGMDVERWAEKLMTSSGESLVDELSLRAVRLPCMLVSISSAMPTFIIDEAGKSRYVDFSSVAGKAILGVGMLLTGAKDFDELVSLAEQGNTAQVDTLIGDIKNKNRTGVDDFYSIMPENYPVFLMGKLCDEKYNGTYSKSDLAAGLLNSYCKLLAKLCLANARLHGDVDLILAGSFLSSHVVRDLFEQCFLYESLTQPFFGGKVVKMGVLEHSGFLCAFGAWQKNLQQEWKSHNGNNQHNQPDVASD